MRTRRRRRDGGDGALLSSERRQSQKIRERFTIGYYVNFIATWLSNNLSSSLFQFLRNLANEAIFLFFKRGGSNKQSCQGDNIVPSWPANARGTDHARPDCGMSFSRFECKPFATRPTHFSIYFWQICIIEKLKRLKFQSIRQIRTSN